MNDASAPEAPEILPLVPLSGRDGSLKRLMIGMGWDLKKLEAQDLDLDCSILLLDRKDQTRIDEDFVFYNNMTGAGGAVQHRGDNRTGIGDGDDETVFINLQDIPFDVIAIRVVVSIYNAYEREHNFTFVKNVFVRFSNEETGAQIQRIDLDAELDDPMASAIIVGDLIRDGMGWGFQPLLTKAQHGLAEIARNAGIMVA